jgi:predicted secreted protein
MSDAKSGVGALLRYYTGSAWVSFGEVTNISGPTMTRATHDVTSLASTGGFREFITGLRDPGTLSFTMFFNRADYEAALDQFNDDDLYDFEIILPDDDHTTLEFTGFVTDLPMEIPEGPMSCNISIKISGPVTINS